ncbi:MAG TPA: TonB-dependent siderophore receptor [Verrucomicrobiae bacterium]|nr:TonB-dependent siderophore receptor [Verrucomicrobiae bacterium]
MNPILTRSVSALVLAQGATAAAQTVTNIPPSENPGTNAATQLPEMTVRGERDSYKPEIVQSPKYTEPLRDIPQTITVVPRAVIQEQGATTLRDVLRNTPGISMQAGEGGGGLPGDNLSIRGFDSRNDIFVDGIRDFGSYSRDPFNLEQVEIAKGPSSATSGRGSTGGSVNLVSKTPNLAPSYDGSFGLGTDDYKRTTLDVNQPLNDIGLETGAFRLNGMWHDADAPGRDVVTESRWALAPSLAFGLGTPTRLTLSYFHMTQDNVPDYGIPWVPSNTNSLLKKYSNKAAPVDFSNFYGLKDYDFEDIETDMATAIFEHDFNESLRLRDLFRYGRNYRNSAITAPRFVDVNTSTLIRRQLQRREMENEIFANQTDVQIDLETGPLEHAIVTGLELSRELQFNRNDAQTANQPFTGLFNPNPNDPPLGPMPQIMRDPSNAQADTLALYAFDTIKLGEKWEATGGLRWDHVEADYRSTTNHFERTDDLISWRAALIYKPRENGSVYFGYGTSFNSSIEGNTGLTLSDSATSGNNFNLKPEETHSFELGTKWELFNERLLLSGALFRTEKVNARTQSAATDETLVLNGEQVVQGIELGASGSITKNWKVTAGYVFMHSEIESSGDPAEVGADFDNTPEHSFSLWTTYTLGDFDLGFGANYVGDRLNNNSGSANPRTAPDYWLFDAMAAYHVNDNVTLRLNVYNLADEDYIDRVGGGHFIPGRGRSAVLAANFSF